MVTSCRIGKYAADPYQYGPHNKTKKTREVRIGVIGTSTGISYFRSWTAQIRKRIEVPPRGNTEKQDRLHIANFPGVEEVFCISLNESDFVIYAPDPKAIDATTRILSLHEAVAKRHLTTKSEGHLSKPRRRRPMSLE